MSGVHLNTRLSLETRVQLPDGAGGYEESWLVVGGLWADIRPRSAREVAGLSGPSALSSYRIIVRAAPVASDRRPRAGQRLVSGLRNFIIEAVTEFDAAQHYLECHAREEVQP